MIVDGNVPLRKPARDWYVCMLRCHQIAIGIIDKITCLVMLIAIVNGGRLYMQDW